MLESQKDQSKAFLSYERTQQLVKRCAIKFDPKPLEAAFTDIFSYLEKCQSEVVDDIISDVAVN